MEATRFKYRAFLSYSHRGADAAWGKWLHGSLEHHTIDKELVGRETPAGLIPKSLRPIFRDREDFAAGPALHGQTIAALEASQFLIVICSPNSAHSKYVNEEIRRFKALGCATCIIPVIIDGEPHDPERECFPPALAFRLNPDGTLSDEREDGPTAMARRLRNSKLWPDFSASISMRLSAGRNGRDVGGCPSGSQCLPWCSRSFQGSLFGPR
jgi:hypothetical protein